MKNLIRHLKTLFGIYESGYYYSIPLADIKISEDFKRTYPNKYKMRRKWKYYNRTGNLQSQIVLGNDFVLRDGYTSYLIAKRKKIKRVNVIFK